MYIKKTDNQHDRQPRTCLIPIQVLKSAQNLSLPIFCPRFMTVINLSY